MPEAGAEINLNNLGEIMVKTIAFLILVITIVFTLSCGGGSTTAKFPGTKDGAQALLREFLKPGADLKKLTMELRPANEDYRAFFKEENDATRAEAFANKMWDSGEAVIAPKEGQTELRLFSATPKQMSAYEGDYNEFPASMLALADDINQDLPIYAFKFVKPGETSGMAFEGLTHVNGKWRIFPKIWRFRESK